VYLALTAVALFVCRTEAQRPRNAGEDIAPAVLYIHTRLIRDELELIRLEMGKPKDRRRALQVAHAEPHEVFSQAVVLFHLVNRLSFDLTRERIEPPEKPIGTPRQAHVLTLLDVVLTQLQRVKATFGNLESSQAQPRDPAMTLSDVLRSIVLANRQIDLLLDRPMTPSDTFQQVTLAVGYAAQLRTRFPGTRMPEPPAFERRKRPADVYHRLIESLDRVRVLMARSGFDALILSQHPETVTPIDVYSIASLLVSELSFLHTRSGSTLSPPDAYYPGRKFPSDVYQRAGLLDILLSDLQTLVETSPFWLQHDDERE
jgi:hypothetical protein